MFDRTDYMEMAERRKKERMNGQTWDLQFLAQAQVHQMNLTGQPEWDRFLSYLQASSERLKAGRMVLKERLCDPQLVDSNEIMAMKMTIVRFDAFLEALDAVISLPKAIMETGEKARERLKEIEPGIPEGD